MVRQAVRDIRPAPAIGRTVGGPGSEAVVEAGSVFAAEQGEDIGGLAVRAVGLGPALSGELGIHEENGFGRSD